ncbi:MAG: proton-conducting transporter membrane subunit [Myxococcota bacterium]
MSGFGTLAVIAPIFPFALGVILPLTLGTPPARSAKLAYFGAIAALGAVSLAITGSMIAGQWGDLPALTSPLRLDSLGALMTGTVAVIGFVVSRFARRYLACDPAQQRFSIWFSYTLTAILIIPIAHHLILLMLAWLMASHGLHHLLTLYPDRPAALLAARKKFLISRLGDALLIAAFAIIYSQWGSFDLSVIFERAALSAEAGQTGAILAISLLVVLGATTKSAQLPFHTWLPETMETPTPVSALMHAGIVNAGGFLVIRLSPLLAHAPSALSLLAYVGGFSAMTGALIMLTQNDVKRKLAYSTISQMGFMMLQCGLGAFSAAMLHLVGHSFYKAHAFLSAGSWVDTKATGQPEVPNKDASPAWMIAFAGVVGLALTGFALFLADVDIHQKPGGGVLASVLALALAQGLVIWSLVLGRRLWVPKNVAIALSAGLAVSLFYLISVGFVDRILGDAISRPLLPVADPSALPGFTLVAMFGVAVLIQTFRPAIASSGIGTRFYILLRNGFYLGEIQNRWLKRLWPIDRPEQNPAR